MWLRGRLSSSHSIVPLQLLYSWDSKGRKLNIWTVNNSKRSFSVHVHPSSRTKEFECCQLYFIFIATINPQILNECYLIVLWIWIYIYINIYDQEAIQISSKTIERNGNIVLKDEFQNAVLLYLACFKIDFMNRATD